MKIVVDSSVLIGLINPDDLWHSKAIALQEKIVASAIDLLYLDCIVTETASVIARRLREKNRANDVVSMIERLRMEVPRERITWVMPEVPRLYEQVLSLMSLSKGALNFNDALIALACRERAILAIASFDADFDQVTWLQRWARPEDVTA